MRRVEPRFPKTRCCWSWEPLRGGAVLVRVALGGQEEVEEPRRKCDLGEQNDKQCPSPKGLGALSLDDRAGRDMDVCQTQL